MSTNIRSRPSISRGRTKSPTITKTETHQANETNYSNKSDDSEESLDEETSYTENVINRNGSFRDKIPPFSPNGQGQRTKSPNNFKKNNSMKKESQNIQTPKSMNVFIKTSIFILLISILALIVCYRFIPSKQDPRECSFSKLETKYPKEDKSLWLHLKYGNENILNNESDKPAVFLFAHNGKEIADTIVKDIAKTSADCSGSSSVLKHMDFHSKEAIKDYGHIIEKYKKSIKEEDVILIANLNKISGEAAKALHSICDTVTPLVKKVIIILTLTVKEQNQQEKLIDNVENTLRELWQHKMKAFELEPIITRVTDQVFLLRSD